MAANPQNTLNGLLWPGPAKEHASSGESYGDLSVLSTGNFLHGLEVGIEYEVEPEPGKRLLLGVQSISEPDERGSRTVVCTVNRQLRPVQVREESVAVDIRQAERADISAPGQVAAPLPVSSRSGSRSVNRSIPGYHRHNRGHQDGNFDHQPRSAARRAPGHRRTATKAETS